MAQNQEGSLLSKRKNVPVQEEQEPKAKSPESVLPAATLKSAFRALYVLCTVSVAWATFLHNTAPRLVQSYGLKPLTFGYIQSTVNFLVLCSNPLLGYFSDTHGAKRVLLFGTVFTVAGFLVIGMGSSVSMLVVGYGLACVDVKPVFTMMTVDIAPPEGREKTLGKLRVFMSLGVIVGAATLGSIAKYFGSQNTIILTSLLPLLALWVIWRWLPLTVKTQGKDNSDHKGDSGMQKVKQLLLNGDVQYFLVLKLLGSLSNWLYLLNIPTIATIVFKLDPQGTGMLSAMLGVLAIIANGFVLGWLKKRCNEDHLFLGSLIFLTLTHVLMAQVTSLRITGILYAPFMISFVISESQMTERLTRSVAKSDTGTVLGFSSAMLSVARVLSPVLGGWLLQTYGMPALCYVCGTLGMVAALLVFFRPAKEVYA